MTKKHRERDRYRQGGQIGGVDIERDRYSDSEINKTKKRDRENRNISNDKEA